MVEEARSVTTIALVRRVAQAMVDDLVVRLADAGYPDISGTSHPVFENIELEGTRLSVLAMRAGVTHQSMSELVRTLERRGYVERRPDPSDGRARLVRLTGKGLRMVHQARIEIEEIERRWQSYWQDAKAGEDLKSLLLEALQRHEADQAGPPVGDVTP